MSQPAALQFNILPLEKRHRDALFQPLMVQCPGLQHAARLDDQRDAMATGKS